MKCPYCGDSNSKVTDSRSYLNGNSIKRRRECEACKKRFTTYEHVGDLSLYVVKKDKKTEKFSREKLLKGLLRALEKSEATHEEIDLMISDIEREILTKYEGKINSKDLGDLTMKYLLDLDEVAYVRFASVYKEFNDLEHFIKEIDKIR